MTPDDQLAAMIDRFTPEVAAVARDAIAVLSARFPQAVRLVYDNYNALAIGFGPRERASEIFLSVALYPRWVSVFLVGANKLPDPHALLEGGGGTMRHVKLINHRIGDPGLITLVDAAAALAPVPLDPAATGYTLIKSISAKQRPRRPD